jgi:hypothetical protein
LFYRGAKLSHWLSLHPHGFLKSTLIIPVPNDYLAKRCWRDQYTPRLHVRLQEAGMPIGSVLTMFDFIDLDEGRGAQCNVA